MRTPATLAIALLMAASGCLAPTSTEGHDRLPPDWAQIALISGEGHDHTDPAQHADMTTPNFVPVGHDPMSSLYYGQTAGGYLCGDAARVADGRVLAAVESRSDVGFALVDVTDPADPRWLGELVMENSYVYDLVVVPDGQHVVLVTAHTKGPNVGAATPSGRVSTPGDVAAPTREPGRDDAPRLTWETPCAPARPLDAVPRLQPDPVPREASILLVDISDPSEPIITEQLRLMGRGHSVFSNDVDGRLLVTAVTLGPDAVNSWVELFELETVGGAGVLLPLSKYKAPVTETEALQGNIWHDGWIAEHPDRGWLLHAVGGHNYHILDINDPRQPTLLGRWNDDDPAAGVWTGNLHGVIPLYGFRPGLDVAVVGPEWGFHPEDHPTGIIRVLDITDLDAIQELGAWTLPYDVTWEEGAVYQYSQHYYAIDDDVMFVSMYHGGIWAVDLSPVEAGAWHNLPSIGHWSPLAPEVESAITVRWAPTNEEVFIIDDHVITFDSNTGLHTAMWTGLKMAAPDPWPMVPLFTVDA